MLYFKSVHELSLFVCLFVSFPRFSLFFLFSFLLSFLFSFALLLFFGHLIVHMKLLTSYFFPNSALLACSQNLDHFHAKQNTAKHNNNNKTQNIKTSAAFQPNRQQGSKGTKRRSGVVAVKAKKGKKKKVIDE